MNIDAMKIETHCEAIKKLKRWLYNWIDFQKIGTYI